MTKLCKSVVGEREKDIPERKETKSTELWNKNELQKIVHSRVDPSSSLRKQYFPALGCIRLALSLGCKDSLVAGKVLHHKGRQIAILPKV